MYRAPGLSDDLRASVRRPVPLSSRPSVRCTSESARRFHDESRSLSVGACYDRAHAWLSPENRVSEHQSFELLKTEDWARKAQTAQTEAASPPTFMGAPTAAASRHRTSRDQTCFEPDLRPTLRAV